MQEQIARMHEKYGDAKRFLHLFKPELQSKVAQQWERAYTGIAPTLQCVAEGYSRELAAVWICLQLESINSFSGAKGKLSIEQQQELAELVLAEYSYLKVSEMLLFFHRLKCGLYGRFYHSVDPQIISTALLLFMQERRRDLDSLRRQQGKGGSPEQQSAEQPSSRAITCEEYLRRKFEKDPQAESILNEILKNNLNL